MDSTTTNTNGTMGFKFIKMKNPDNIFVETLLGKGLFDDYLFEKTFFKLKIKLNDLSRLLYRRLWESNYIRSGMQSHIESDDSVTLYVSVSEALLYINTVTPPILKHLIADSTKSIDDIGGLIEQLLSDESSNNDIRYNISVFLQIMKLEKFETVWRNDTTQMKYLLENNHEQQPCGCCCYVIHANRSLSSILSTIRDKRDTTPYPCVEPLKVYAMFSCRNKTDDIRSLMHTLTDHWQIVNVTDTLDDRYYIVAYGDINDSRSMSLFGEIIERSYMGFI